MPLEHLQGKRTGRPRGSKSSSPLKRDLRWACRNLGKDVEPPTAGAKFWSEMARNEPEKFVKAVAELDAANGPSRNKPDESQNRKPETYAGQRLKRTFLAERDLLRLLRSFPGVDIPIDSKVVGYALARDRDGVMLTISAPTFRKLAEGEPIPEMQRYH
jgi:hypothetical protein